MVSPRADRLRAAIGRDTLPVTDVGDERLFVWNYQLRDADVEGWHLVSTRHTRLPDGIGVGRTTWQPTGPTDELLQIESYECPTREAAHGVLLELLADFHVPRDFSPDPDAPAGLQLLDASGTNALAVIGNLVLRIRSGGAAPIPARVLSEQVLKGIASRPAVDTEQGDPGGRPRRPTRVAVGESIAVEPRRSRRDRSAEQTEPAPYIKIFSRGGDVRAVDDELVFVADEPGEAEAVCYSVTDEAADAERVRFVVSADTS